MSSGLQKTSPTANYCLLSKWNKQWLVHTTRESNCSSDYSRSLEKWAKNPFCRWSQNCRKSTLMPVGSHHCPKGSGVQPWPKSWGEPRFRTSQHRDWLGVGCGRGLPCPLPLWGSKGITPGKFLKTQMLNPAFWWLLCLLVGWSNNTCCEIYCFLKTMAKKLGDQYIVGPQPKSWGNSPPSPYGCCT